MSLLTETLDVFYDPDKKPTLLDFKNKYESVWTTFNRDFYTLTLDKHPEITASLEKILNKLNVPPSQHGRYLNQKMTVYACLVELNDTVENKELAEFIQWIHNKKQARWRSMLLGGVLVSAVGLVPFFAFQLTVLQQVLTVASMLSGGGFVYTCVIAAFTAYDVSANSDVSFYQLFRDNFYSVVKNALSIAAWSILIIAAVTTPLVSVLFVLADVMLVVKEISSLVYLYVHDHFYVNMSSNQINPQTKARQQTDLELRKRTAWINFSAAVLMTAIIAAWCFVPGGIFIVAGSMLAIGVVYLAKMYAINESERQMKAVLLEKFIAIEQGNDPTMAPSLQNEADLLNNTTMQAALNAPIVKSTARETHTIDMPPENEDSLHYGHIIPGLEENSLFGKKDRHHGDSGSDHAPRSQREKS